MADKSIFRSLREVFPQVDLRILKAVAIEHRHDADEAVEFILSEVLPSLSEPSEESHTHHETQDHPSMGNEVIEKASASEANTREHNMDGINYDSENATSHFKPSLEKTKAHDSPSDVDPLDAYFSEQTDGTVAMIATAQDSDGSGDKETFTAMHANVYNSSPGIELPDLLEFENAVSANLSSSPLETLVDSTTIGAEPVKNAAMENDQKVSTCLAESVAEAALENEIVPSVAFPDLMDFENAAYAVDSTVTTRSGHVVSIDFLEDFINNSKSHKKALTSAVETASNMLKDVELLEETAKHAKEGASVTGQLILAKVEELKQMSKHAKEANEMHAGEVYGEKAILAAEARELQSRLLNLSIESNRYLPIIEEIRQTLEARLVYAQKAILAVEQENHEKEENALKALNEQELLMEKMVEESKKLQQEAEENSKLREFLVDRGHMVDTLQGEITVICEDVLSLKDRVEGRVPFSRYPSSMASSLASSSSSSIQSRIIARGIVLLPVEPPESLHNTNPEQPRVMEVYDGDKHKVPSDDEWELFEAED